MKIAIFSDIHGHNFREFSHIRDDGINSRLYHQIEVMEWIKGHVDSQNLSAVFFGGDLTHLKNNVDSQVVEKMLWGFDRLAGSAPVFMIPGNHDYRMWSSDPALMHIVDSLDGNLIVMEQGLHNMQGYIQQDELWVYASPYTRSVKDRNQEIIDLSVAENSKTIFFGHQDIKGVHYGGFEVVNGLDPDTLSNKFIYSFIGHCHDMLEVRPNVISIGAPMEHNFSDEGKDHGFWILDTSQMTIEFVQNIMSPRFHTLQYGDTKATKFVGDPENDFYRVILDGVDEPDEVKSIRHKRLMRRPSQSGAKRTTISVADSSKDIIEKYVEARAGKLDQDRLIEIGRKLL